MSDPNTNPDSTGNFPIAVPLEYASSDLRTRPTRSTVMAILGIIYSAWGLLTGLMGLVSLAALPAMSAFRVPTTGPTSAPVFNMAGMYPLMIGSAVIGLVGAAIAVVLLIGSIRLLKDRMSGLRMMRAWAWIYIVYGVIATLVAAWLQYEMQRGMWSQMGTPMPPGMMLGVMIGTVVIGILFRLVYPVLVLTLLRGESVTRVLR